MIMYALGMMYDDVLLWIRHFTWKIRRIHISTYGCVSKWIIPILSIILRTVKTRVSQNGDTPKSSILIGFSMKYTIQLLRYPPNFGCWSTLQFEPHCLEAQLGPRTSFAAAAADLPKCFLRRCFGRRREDKWGSSKKHITHMSKTRIHHPFGNALYSLYNVYTIYSWWFWAVAYSCLTHIMFF